MKKGNDHSAEQRDHRVDRDGAEIGNGNRTIIRAALIAPIRFYQRFISPLTPPQCRFTPTCSEYARQAILKHGPIKGVWLGIVRLLKCHPFHQGGHDPVP